MQPRLRRDREQAKSSSTRMSGRAKPKAPLPHRGRGRDPARSAGRVGVFAGIALTRPSPTRRPPSPAERERDFLGCRPKANSAIGFSRDLVHAGFYAAARLFDPVRVELGKDLDRVAPQKDAAAEGQRQMEAV